VVTPESVELDFDPDLFPSEALELDQENAASLQLYPSGDYAQGYENGAVTPGELAMSGESMVLDDEAFIEMISSPELEFDSDLFSEESIDSDPEDTASIEPYFPWSDANEHDNSTQAPEEQSMPEGLSAPDQAAVAQQVQDESLESDQDTTKPQAALENVSDVFLETPQNSQQEDTTKLSAQAPAERSIPEEASAADETALTEDKPSNSLTQEEQRLDASNFEVDLLQPEVLNPSRSDNEKKNNRNSDSEANQ
jgi:hypothetical protein